MRNVVACVASVSVVLGSKERRRNGISVFCPRESWGEGHKKNEGVGEGKKNTACKTLGALSIRPNIPV